MQKSGKPKKEEESQNNNLYLIKDYYVLSITLSILICSSIGYYSEYNLLSIFGLNILAFAEIDDFFLAGLKYPKIFIYTIIFVIVVLVGLYQTVEIINHIIRLRKLDNVAPDILSKTKQIEELEDKIIEGIKNEKTYITTIENLKWYKKFIIKLYLIIADNKHEKILNQLYTNLEKVNDLKTDYKYVKKIKNLKIKLTFLLFAYLIIIPYYVVMIKNTLNNNLAAQMYKIFSNPKLMATVQLSNKTLLAESLNLNQPLIFITATNKFMFFYQYGTKEKTSAIAIPISSILNVHYSDFKIETETECN